MSFETGCEKTTSHHLKPGFFGVILSMVERNPANSPVERFVFDPMIYDRFYTSQVVFSPDF